MQKHEGKILEEDRKELSNMMFLFQADVFGYKEPLCVVYLRAPAYDALMANVQDKKSFSQLLQARFFENFLQLSYTDYIKLFKQHEVPNKKKNQFSPEDMIYALKKWIKGDNYAKAVKWGKILNKLVHYLPAEVREVPTENTMLYRGVHVKKEAFDKLLQSDKPLVLKNRKYSSWTTDRGVAKSFGGSGIPEALTGVVLGRKFSKQALLLDVDKVAIYLGMLDDIDRNEHEIIVKNGNIDYKFTAKDVVAYKETRGWWKEI